MNFEQIKSFLSVAKTGSFSASAKERFISQPTISNHLRMLEEELNTQLFLRNTKNIALTEDGKIFYQYANKLLAVEKDIFCRMKGKQENYYGMLDIVVPHLQTDRQMGSFFNRIIREGNEGVTCRIVERDDEEIPDIILTGEVELGVCHTILNSPHLEYEKAFVEEILLITPSEEKYRDLSPQKLRELIVQEGHIRFDFGSGSDFLWNDFFGKIIGVGLSNIRTVARCSNYNLVLKAVEDGCGIAFISNTVMQEEWKSGKILAYRCRELLEKQFYVVYNKERTATSKVIQHTKDMLVEELKKSITHPEKSF